jgi:hypothetical protein
MRLRLDGRQFHLPGRHPQVEPGRDLGDVDPLGAVEDELADDLLGPGRAGLGIGGDDDVVRKRKSFQTVESK